MSTRKDSMSGQIAAIIQQSEDEQKAALKAYDKALDIMLKSKLGCGLKEVTKIVEADRKRKQKLAEKTSSNEHQQSAEKHNENFRENERNYIQSSHSDQITKLS